MRWLLALRPQAVPASAWLGAAVLLGVVSTAVFSPLAGYPVGADVDPTIASQGIVWAHPLGTDHLGRDVFMRLALATRAFVGPGVLAMALAAMLGAPLGLASGMQSGPLRSVLGWLPRTIASVPRLVWLVLILGVFDDGPWQLGLAMGVALFPDVFDTVFDQVSALRDGDYVLANRAHGVPTLELWVGHLLIGACGARIARTLLRGFAATLVFECTLSYLGAFGVQEPMPSWGNMLVFEWGRGLGPQSLAPIVALGVTLWACFAASAWFQEPAHG